MKENDHVILAVHITDRMERVPTVQHLFSEFGCYIQTRLGLHEVSDHFCSPNGIIILQMVDGEKVAATLEEKLNAITGVEAKKLVSAQSIAARALGLNL
jgi:hypothetical protein